MEIEEIKQIFQDEFAPVFSKFKIIDFPITQANNFHESTDRPGVYVYWKEDKVIKVGRHLANARKRALEHIRDNTGGKMASLKNDTNCWFILFTVDKNEYHWAATPEMFLEMKLNPEIKSGRLG